MKLAVRILVVWIVLVGVFTGIMVVAFFIPSSRIEDNVRQSVQQIAANGTRFNQHVSILQPFKVGDFTDGLMLNIAYRADSKHPLQSAMNDEFVMHNSSPIEGAAMMIEHPDNSELQPIVYSRYWHGNQALLRPLLCVTDIQGLHIINIVLLAIMVLALLCALWKRVSRADALIVTLCLAAVMIPSVPLCLNYVPTFYIALTVSLAILLWPATTANRDRAVILFFVTGGLTAFFDLLTTPMVAMAVPLMVYMLYRKPANTWKTVIILALAWLLGYALLWASKWLLAAIITGGNVFQDAYNTMALRSWGEGANEQDYMAYCMKMTCMALVGVTAAVTIVTALWGKSWRSVRSNSWMLLLGMASFVWTFVSLQHTWHHIHFTWRTYVVLLLGVLLFLYHTLDLRHPFALFRK